MCGMGDGLSRQVTAIDRVIGAGQKPGGGREEKTDEFGDVLGGGEAADGVPLDEFGALFRRAVGEKRVST